MKKLFEIVIVFVLITSYFMGIIGFTGDNAEAGTPKSGTISSNETWDVAGSPYWINGNITVEPGVTLTIDPDVEVKFNGLYNLFIEGDLIAVGTEGNKINISSNSTTPTVGDWESIYINSTGRAEIKYCNISYGSYAIVIDSSSNNNVTHNTLLSNLCGVQIIGSTKNTVENNNISLGGMGIRMESSSYNNMIILNNVSVNSNYGIYLSSSSGNRIFHNIFASNTIQAFDDTSNNSWNDSYSSGGNYWSDWSPICPDLYNGFLTPQTTGFPDGICDLQYDIDGDSMDYYPLKNIYLSPPYQPFNLTASSGDSYIQLTWNAPGWEGGSPVTNYRIYRGTVPDGETFLIEIGNVLYYNDTGVNNNVTYYYRVSALNDVGEGDMSDESSDIPIGPPLAPQNLLAIAESGLIILTWTAPASDGGATITNYRVHRGLAPDSETILVEVGNIFIYYDAGLTNGVTYYYKVSAVNSRGEGQISDEANATPFSIPVADAGPDIHIAQGGTAFLNGSGSWDEGGVISNFTWSFSYDGSSMVLYDEFPGFTFDIPGTYGITLTVKNPSNMSGTDKTWIFVNIDNDSDDDGLLDSWEVDNFLDLLENATGDPDGDGFTNIQEFYLGTDPLFDDDVDHDDDGLLDSWEIDNFGDLSQNASQDPDGDGVTNIQELYLQTDPNVDDDVDHDDDGLLDSWEITHFGDLSQFPLGDPDDDDSTNIQEFYRGTDPTVSNKITLDTDGDGLVDAWEIEHFDGLHETPVGDPDSDSFINIQEFYLGSDPNFNNNPDSDADGLPDFWEYENFEDLNQSASDDPDSDELTNIEEFYLNTNPNVPQLDSPEVAEETSDLWWLGWIVAIVLLVLLLVSLLTRKKSKGPEEDLGSETAEEGEQEDSFDVDETQDIPDEFDDELDIDDIERTSESEPGVDEMDSGGEVDSDDIEDEDIAVTPQEPELENGDVPKLIGPNAEPEAETASPSENMENQPRDNAPSAQLDELDEILKEHGIDVNFDKPKRL